MTLFACQHECLQAQWLSTNVAEIKLAPASFTLLPLSLTTRFKEYLSPNHCSISSLFSLVLKRTDHLSSGSILIWLSNRQQHCPSPAQKQEVWGWITCGSLSLRILSNLPHELQAGLCGGAASPSIGSERTTAVKSSSRWMRTVLTYSVVLISINKWG